VEKENEGSNGDGVDQVDIPPDKLSQKEGQRHDRRPDHRGSSFDEKGVKDNRGYNQQVGEASGNPRELEDGEEKESDNSDMRSGDGNDVKNSRLLERLSVGGRHSCPIAQEKSLENGSLRRKRVVLRGGKMFFYFLLQSSMDDGYQAEGREFSAGFQSFDEKRTLGEGPAMDILTLEIPLRRECLEVSEPLIEEEAGRNPDFIADKQVRRERKLL
jgi:hypothetical protein